MKSHRKWRNSDVVSKRMASRPQLNNAIFQGNTRYGSSNIECAYHTRILFLKNTCVFQVFYLSVRECSNFGKAWLRLVIELVSFMHLSSGGCHWLEGMSEWGAFRRVNVVFSSSPPFFPFISSAVGLSLRHWLLSDVTSLPRMPRGLIATLAARRAAVAYDNARATHRSSLGPRLIQIRQTATRPAIKLSS